MSEFYDVGRGRGRAEIDSTNRTQVYTRIRAGREDAVVMDNDTKHVEVWIDGELGDRFPLGTKLPEIVMEDLRAKRGRNR